MDFTLAPVTIQQIIVFLRVADSGGFAKASNYLHMTQSAVSKNIAKLEKDLEIVLFRRTTREIHLTEAGKILYDEWKTAMNVLHKSYIRAASVQNENNKILRIGILNTARPERYFWDIQEQFVKKHPNIQIDLTTAYMTDLEKDLAQGEFDLIMIPDFERFAIEDLGLCWKWAARSNARIIMSKNHPLAKRASLKTTDILSEKFTPLEQKGRQSYQEDLIERFAKYHVKPIFIPGYKNAYEIQLLFRSQEDALLMADEYFDYPEDANLIKVTLDDQINGIICVWNPNNQNPQLQAFLNDLRPVSGTKTDTCHHHLS